MSSCDDHITGYGLDNFHTPQNESIQITLNPRREGKLGYPGKLINAFDVVLPRLRQLKLSVPPSLQCVALADVYSRILGCFGVYDWRLPVSNSVLGYTSARIADVAFHVGFR
eukprot:137224-Pelagomonas_calceolata.AAC.12